MREGRGKYLVSLCLLVLYVVFQAGITVFPHEHILNGEKFVHSHPYSNANHSHTSDQVLTIARLSSVQTLEAQFACSQEVELHALYALDFNEDSSKPKAPQIYCVGLRAPPFC